MLTIAFTFLNVTNWPIISLCLYWTDKRSSKPKYIRIFDLFLKTNIAIFQFQCEKYYSVKRKQLFDLGRRSGRIRKLDLSLSLTEDWLGQLSISKPAVCSGATVRGRRREASLCLSFSASQTSLLNLRQALIRTLSGRNILFYFLKQTQLKLFFSLALYVSCNIIRILPSVSKC